MKLRFSDPVVVSRGPDARFAGWGGHQFPNICKLDDGKLVYTFNICADSETAYGSKPGCCVSTDGGKTWTADDPDNYTGQLGVKLPNGDVLSAWTGPSIPMNGLKLPKPLGRTTWLGHTIYAADEIDFCNRGWIFVRSNAEHPKGIHEESKVNQPYFMMRSCQGVFVPPSPRGRLRIAPDGTLWMPHYYLAGTDPKNGAYIPYLCNYLFKSTDEGRTWEMTSHLLYKPDTDVDPQAYFYEGYGENDITFAPDGSMIRLIRTNGDTIKPGPCYFTRSTDGGYTWSEPTQFDWLGVWPCLLTLKCGVTLASYGRPGIRVRTTADPACLEWDEPVEILESIRKPEPYPGHTLNTASCCYTNMIALDDRTAALVYSDFRVKDEQGIPRKTMMFRTITVED